MKTVSVIIPCYNQGQYLKESVQSVLDSTYKDIEIIIVNDGSTDKETIEILNSFSMPKTRIINQENAGLSAARNKAIENSAGKYILPLDSDDRIHKEYIAKAVEILDSNQNIGIVGPKTELFGYETGIFDLPKYKFPEILLGNLLVCSCIYRKEDWQTVNGYNSNMKYGLEDWDFWLSLIELGREVYQFDEVTFYYRKHEVSMITEVKGQRHQEMIQQIIKNHIDLYLRNKPELFELLMGISRVESKIKKYKKLFFIFLSISIILFIIVLYSLL